MRPARPACRLADLIGLRDDGARPTAEGRLEPHRAALERAREQRRCESAMREARAGQSPIAGLSDSRKSRAAASASRPGRRGELLDEFRADFRRRGQPMRALKAAKSAAGGGVFGAIGFHRISELRERDLGGAHQMRSVIDRLATQKSGDLVGGARGDRSLAAIRARGRRWRRGWMLLVLRGWPDRGRCVRCRRSGRARLARCRGRGGRGGIGRRDRRWGCMRGDRLNGRPSRGRACGSRQGIVSRRGEKRRRMPPDLQQKRIAADSCDERRQACADEASPRRRHDPLSQQARRPEACRPQQGCRITNAYEGFHQASFPQQLIRKTAKTVSNPSPPTRANR